MAMPSYDLFTVGQSNIAAERFVAMVKSLHYSLLTELVAGSMA